MGDGNNDQKEVGGEGVVRRRFPSPFSRLPTLIVNGDNQDAEKGRAVRGVHATPPGYENPRGLDYVHNASRRPSDVEPLEFSTMVETHPESVLKVLQEGALIKLGSMSITDQEAIAAFGKSTMITRGRDVCSDVNFEHFWRTELEMMKKSNPELHLGWSQQVRLTAYVLYVKGATAAGFDGLLHKILMNWKAGTCDLEIFELPVVRAMIDYKWESWIGKVLAIELLLYICWMVTFSLFMIFFLIDPQESVRLTDASGRGGAAFVSLTLAFVLMWPFVVIEFFTVAAYGRKWFSLWNVIDVACYGLQIIVFVVYVSNNRVTMDEPWFSICLALETILLFSRLGYYGRAFGSVDVSIVDTLKVVLNEVKWFLLFIFLTIFSYGLAFCALFRTSDYFEDGDVVGNFNTIAKAIMTTFGFMLGAIQLNYFFEVEEEIGIPAGIVFVIYEVLINITLLNLLVAVMIEAYDKSKKKEAATNDLNRALAIDEVEMTLPTFIRGNPRNYIHMLVVKDVKDEFFPESVSLPAALYHQESFGIFRASEPRVDVRNAKASMTVPNPSTLPDHTLKRSSMSMPNMDESLPLSAVMEHRTLDSEYDMVEVESTFGTQKSISLPFV